MANIQPFKAIRPNPFFADQLVFTKPQTESVAGDLTKENSLKPIKILLESGARLKPETPEGQQTAYREICDTVLSLLENGLLWQEETAGIYVYEVVHKTYRQTGIWALTSLENARNGSIKIHELTFADSVRRLKNYRENTALEGSPILLAYPPCLTVNRIIAFTKTTLPKIALGNQSGIHKLWKVEARETQSVLIAAFAAIPDVYLSDGHHRLESAVQLAAAQKETGQPVYDQITSLYMATDQLRIQEFHRVIVPYQMIDRDMLFKQLNKSFFIQESKHPVRPSEPHRIGMCLYSEWYHLLAKAHTYADKNISAGIDAAILQEEVLAPFFGINDPKTDPRLKCAGGENAMEEVGAILQSHPGAIAFTLSPLTVEQLIAVADAGEVLPPKSTWIDPKIPYGLLLHKH